MAETLEALDWLRQVLLETKASGPDGFEGLVAGALAIETGLVFRLAKSGSQFGRDASSSSSRFAVAMEAKRYETDLRLEDLAGKAFLAGHFLEGDIDLWVLGATSEVGDDVVPTSAKDARRLWCVTTRPRLVASPTASTGGPAGVGPLLDAGMVCSASLASRSG